LKCLPFLKYSIRKRTGIAFNIYNTALNNGTIWGMIAFANGEPMKRKNENTASLNVLQEQANVDKKIVESGKVYIHKKVHQTDEEISVPVSHEAVTIKKVPVNKYVDVAPSVRNEGNTTIIPVIKEVLVVEKKLMLVEEVHVIKNIVEKTEEHTIPLRKEEIEVERYKRES
jgi:uncharacterized protein (TIGR02271 family)